MNPFKFLNEEEQIYKLNEINKFKRGTLSEIHIADIHFGALEPSYQYQILKEQFLNKINEIHFDILSIDGDLFDHKYMSNSDVVMYASMFINDCVEICYRKKATMIIIHGTYYHDSNQLKLFYHYLKDSNLDVRIIEEAKFEYIKGAKILCIPELYGKKEDYYNDLLLYSGYYDSVFMHGTLEGASRTIEYQESEVQPTKTHIFSMQDFRLCKGLIISGHVHPGGCYNGYFYYTGVPYRWQFDHEGEKGFLIVLHNLDTQEHYVYLEPIKSFIYRTINLDKMLMQDPKQTIDYITELKEKEGIDYIRLEFKKELTDQDMSNLELLKNYYRNNSHVKIKYENKKNKQILKANQEMLEKYKEYDYILDKNLTEYDKLCMFINQKQECEYITVDELQELLKEGV